MTIYYVFSEGEDFKALEEPLPLAFQHLKFDLIQHTKISTHIVNLKHLNKLRLSFSYFCFSSKQAVINWATVAYLTYKLKSSYKDYEIVITEFNNCGAEVGLKKKNIHKNLQAIF